MQKADVTDIAFRHELRGNHDHELSGMDEFVCKLTEIFEPM